jgi:hypothetical protein
MRRRILIAILCIMALAACQTNPIPPTSLPETPTPHAATPLEFEFEGQSELALDGLTIGLPKPKGWESLSTETGMIIAERFARLVDRGVQQGLMAFVFVTPLSDFPDTGSASEQRTQDILTHLIAAYPDDEHRSSDVLTFTWSGYDAAYYLLSEADSGPQMLMVGVTLPDEGVLLTGAVSAPRARAGQIREAAPLLLGGVAVNGAVLGRDGLDTLPDPLVFPE